MSLFMVANVEILVMEQIIGQIYSSEKFKVDNVKKQVEEIKSDLLMIEKFLKDADARQSKQELVRSWVRQIKDLTYRIEDAIETFVIRVEARNEKNIRQWNITRILNKIISSENFKDSIIEAAQLKIDEIKSYLANLRLFRETFARTEAESSSISINENPTFKETWPSHYPAGQRPLVGKEEYMKLLSSMFDEIRNHRVISICGMVGIGKTTLARFLWDHLLDIKKEGDVFAFLHIPHPFSFKLVIERILHQFFKDKPEEANTFKDMEENQLLEKWFNFQKDHRCFICLDNIRSKDVWEELRKAFPLAKLLITTRSIEVAEISTAGEGMVHRMRCLTEKDAHDLFTQHLRFQRTTEPNSIDPEMMNKGRDLIKGCKGLPLGIVAVVDMLKLHQGSIAHDNIKVFAEVLQALTPMYFELPYHLKSCLLYIATFRKDTKVSPEKLYHLWMAEGLISSYQNPSEMMMHIAESYLNELRLRCIVDVQEEEVATAAKRFKSCSLHDLIHEFCVFMGRQEEFFMVMENEKEQIPEPSSSTDSTRRVVFYVGKNDNTKPLDRVAEKLRCLLVQNAPKNQESVTYEMLSYLMNRIMLLKFLRILDFDGIDFGNMTLPKGIANLVHLRYLSFAGCVLHSLPASIGNLLYLQILDLRVITECKLRIPNVLNKMKRLRHLYLPLTFQTHGGEKLRLDGLTLLETLENFNMEVCDVEDLFTLTKVWYLTINIEGNFGNHKRLIDLMSSISEHVRSSLNVKNFDCYSEVRHSVFRKLLACPTLHLLYMEGHLGQLPPYFEISKNISKMRLSGSQLFIDPMPTLEKLPNLWELTLDDEAFVGKEIICSASNFPELRRLELSNLCNLERWILEEGAMSKLSSLKIENCSQLIMLQDGLRFLKNLPELKIVKMPETFNDALSAVDRWRADSQTSVTNDE